MLRLITGCLTIFLLLPMAMAEPVLFPNRAPQAMSCIKGEFITHHEESSNSTVKLKLTNHCNKAVNLQNAILTFENKTQLFAPVKLDFTNSYYSDENMALFSDKKGDHYQANVMLNFNAANEREMLLAAKASVILSYPTDKADYIADTLRIYLTNAVNAGTVEIHNASAKPLNVLQNYATIHLRWNGHTISNLNLPWGAMAIYRGLVPGNYGVLADVVKDATGLIIYRGTATPNNFNLASNQTIRSTVKYALATNFLGKVSVRVSPLPAQLSGYPFKPSAHIVESATGSTSILPLTWGQTATESLLKVGATYSFTTPDINYNGYQCNAVFTPITLVANAIAAPVTNLAYNCTQVGMVNVTLKVAGAPASTPSVNVVFIPNNNTAEIRQTVGLTNGEGAVSFPLTAGVVYNVNADSIAGYNISYNPQPLAAQNNAIEMVSYNPQSSGGTPVQVNGQLQVCGTQLCNQNGMPIQLKGMSSHGLQWYGWGKCLTPASLDVLAKDFKASVIRVSLYVQEGGYETNPTAFTQQVNTLIEQATARGLYVIVDWHMLEPGDPNYNLERAKKFFTDIATAHRNKNNLLYEIANEPSEVSWATIKRYAEQLIPVIRAIDNKSPIIVGTVAWSSLGVSDGRTSQDIISSPITFPNIMYSFHFYAASHKDEYLQELDKASKVLPIFVTEFGTQQYTGDGPNDFTMANRYLDLMAARKIGWTNWNYSDDFRSGAIWTTGTCPNGPWTDSRLKPAGVYIKNKIKS